MSNKLRPETSESSRIERGRTVLPRENLAAPPFQARGGPTWRRPEGQFGGADGLKAHDVAGHSGKNAASGTLHPPGEYPRAGQFEPVGQVRVARWAAPGIRRPPPAAAGRGGWHGGPPGLGLVLDPSQGLRKRLRPGVSQTSSDLRPEPLPPGFRHASGPDEAAAGTACFAPARAQDEVPARWKRRARAAALVGLGIRRVKKAPGAHSAGVDRSTGRPWLEAATLRPSRRELSGEPHRPLPRKKKVSAAPGPGSG